METIRRVLEGLIATVILVQETYKLFISGNEGKYS